MARYIKELVLNKPEDFVSIMMNDYQQKNKFAMSDWKGEPAYRAGDAMMEGYKYLKWSYSNGTLRIEAWLKGSFGKEMGLEGFVATLQKKPFRQSLEQLYSALQQDIPNGQESGAAIPVQTVDNSGAATMALVFGIISVILAFIWPLGAIICAVLGYSRARMGSGSSKAGQAKAGQVLSIIGVVIAFIMWILNVVLLFL